MPKVKSHDAQATNRHVYVLYDVAIMEHETTDSGRRYAVKGHTINKNLRFEARTILDLVSFGATPQEARDNFKLMALDAFSRHVVIKMLPADNSTNELIHDRERHPFLYLAHLYLEIPRYEDGQLSNPHQVVGFAKSAWDMVQVGRKLRATHIRVFRILPGETEQKLVWQSAGITALGPLHD